MSTEDQLSGEAGWTATTVLPGTPFRPRFVSGDDAADRIRIRYYMRPDGGLTGRAWFGEGASGPPGHVHGGALAAVLDEAMGAAAWNAGHSVVLAKLTTENRRMVPLREVVDVVTDVEEVDGRKVRVRGRIVRGDEPVFVEAEGLFVVVDSERFASR